LFFHISSAVNLGILSIGEKEKNSGDSPCNFIQTLKDVKLDEDKNFSKIVFT
jgi:hypothetical protein